MDCLTLIPRDAFGGKSILQIQNSKKKKKLPRKDYGVIVLIALPRVVIQCFSRSAVSLPFLLRLSFESFVVLRANLSYRVVFRAPSLLQARDPARAS